MASSSRNLNFYTPSMASSSSNIRQEEDSYIEYGVSYVKVHNMESCGVRSTNHHLKDPDLTSEQELPPYIIVVHGPPKVGKTLLIKCLVNFYTKGRHSDIAAGPVRIVAGGKRRIQFVECPNNVNGMIDAAKYADAVIFLVDAGYEFEMETFEFLELLKVHGMPKVMGVLTYLDSFKNEYVLAKTQQRLLDQFQTEICKGAQVFCLSGLHNTMYLKDQIGKLASYISTMEFHPSSWRAARTYMLVDHFKDVTPQETVQMDKECPRNIILEGYLRGCHIEAGTKVHIAGVGDFPLASVTSLADPFHVPYVVSDLAESTWTEDECCRAGTYVRFKFHDVPFEMVKNHNPCHPILVGGITTEEEAVGCIQVKLELHSWHLKLLKSKDPIIVSVGWKVCYGRYQFLRHTPQNRPCFAVFMGLLAPVNAGLAIVQNLADNKAAFRFLAKAFVVHVNQAAQIVKRSKQIGTPKRKISKRDTTFMHVCEKVEVPRFLNPIMGGPEPLDRIWECKVDTCGASHLSAAADFVSFYKSHINPSEPKDEELISRCVRLRLAQFGEAPKEEKLAIERQIKELQVECDQRSRELRSKGVLPRRRQTLEQLRGVRFIKVKELLDLYLNLFYKLDNFMCN
ncbi:hypothetical protein MKW92_015982 [Papaver armeniacum]|nr:hypothetical protein MKW92_015982 [Papaver armeniacum]